ncbi:MAG: hypothetical protein QOJ79_966 [Actinomycetota bacterium]|jgi:hypothetical protein|nr:hypothetical protein [Actinomycetota bacterium]
MGMPVRRAVEKRSAPVLVLLTQQHRAVVPLLSVLLLIGGLAMPVPVGVVCLAVLAAFVGWLTFLSWPALVAPARLVRVTTLLLIVFALVSRLV